MSQTDSPTAQPSEFPWETYPDAVKFDGDDPHTTYTFITETPDDADELVDMCARFSSLQFSPTYISSWLLPSGFAVSVCVHDNRGVSSHEAVAKLMDPPMKLTFAVRKHRYESSSLLRVYASPDIEHDVLNRFPAIEDYKRVRSSANLLLLDKNEFNTKSRDSLQTFVANRFGHNLPFILTDDTRGIEVTSQRQSFSFEGLAANEIAPSYQIDTGDSDTTQETQPQTKTKSTYMMTPSDNTDTEPPQSAD